MLAFPLLLFPVSNASFFYLSISPFPSLILLVSLLSQVETDRKNRHSDRGQHRSRQRTRSSGLRRRTQILQDVPEEVYRRPGAQGHL